jgi:predicted RNase H-like HicB family nuclease
MRFVITLDRDEDGVWIAECPSIPGCVSQGSTKEQAVTNIREAIVGCLEARAEIGLPLTARRAISRFRSDAAASGAERPRGRAGV